MLCMEARLCILLLNDSTLAWKLMICMETRLCILLLNDSPLVWRLMLCMKTRKCIFSLSDSGLETYAMHSKPDCLYFHSTILLKSRDLCYTRKYGGVYINAMILL